MSPDCKWYQSPSTLNDVYYSTGCYEAPIDICSSILTQKQCNHPKYINICAWYLSQNQCKSTQTTTTTTTTTPLICPTTQPQTPTPPTTTLSCINLKNLWKKSQCCGTTTSIP
jgi:hypothetical protein